MALVALRQFTLMLFSPEMYSHRHQHAANLIGKNDTLTTCKSTCMVFHPDQPDSDSNQMNELDPQWLEQLYANVNQPPLLQRDPLVLGETVIGSVVSDAFSALVKRQDFFCSDELRLIQTTTRPIWKIMGNATNVLQRIAHVMREAKYARAAEQWRDEAFC